MDFINNLSRKEKITLISIVVLIFAIPIGLFLSKQSQIFKPKATAIVCASNQNGRPVSQTCVDGSKFLVYEYAESDQCKLFYEAMSGSCTETAGSPTPPPGGSPTPPPSATPQPKITPPPDGSIAAICYSNKSTAKVGEEVEWRVDAEGGQRPYKISWGGTEPLDLVGDNDSNFQKVTYDTPGVKGAIIRVRDSSNYENFPPCPTITITEINTPPPSASPTPTPTPSSTPQSTPTPTPTPSISPPPGGFRNGDINRDGRVDILDFSILLSRLGTKDAKADLNKDGIVDLQDYSILLSNWTR